MTPTSEIPFTPNQLRILKLLCFGFDTNEIAEIVHISPGSITRRHKYDIRRKIAQSLGRPPGWMNERRLLIWAVQHNLVDPHELRL